MGRIHRLILTIIVVSYPLSYALDHGHMVFHFHGTGITSEIGLQLNSLSDLNHDGFDDIALSSWSPPGTYVFFGGNPTDSSSDYFFPGNWTMANYMDYSADGIPDIVISNINASYTGGIIYLYKGLEDSISSSPNDSILAPDSLSAFWLMCGGDVKGDPTGDLLVYGHNPYEGDILFLYIKPFVQNKDADCIYFVENHSHRISNAGFIDFNGDKTSDIFVSLPADLDTLAFIYIFLGPDFSLEPDIIIGPPSEIDSLDREFFALGSSNIGDINGDGWEDLGVSNRPSSISLIYLGGPEADTIYDFRLDGGCTYMSKAGDLNGDSYNDLAVGGSDSYFGHVIIYLGGPQFDTTRDDFITKYDLPPLFLDKIGYKISPAGDFNRDGYEDLLFSCHNWTDGEPGDVFIFSWGDDIVDVKGADEAQNLPKGFILYQNYPNPFNSSTTIRFELPRKEIINLEIFNILGQKVAVLAENKLYQPGRHVVQWDGVLSNGNPAPSGVYFYRLRGNTSESTRRMVLLK
jgi:hypothetical protein